MKHTIRRAIALAAVLAATAAAAHAELYPATFMVTDTWAEEDTLVLTSASGNEYLCFGIEDWMVGDLCSAIMDDCGTPLDVTDDRIVDMRYAGYFD